MLYGTAQLDQTVYHCAVSSFKDLLFAFANTARQLGIKEIEVTYVYYELIAQAEPKPR